MKPILPSRAITPRVGEDGFRRSAFVDAKYSAPIGFIPAELRVSSSVGATPCCTVIIVDVCLVCHAGRGTWTSASGHSVLSMRPSISGIVDFGERIKGADDSVGQVAGVAASTPSGKDATVAAPFFRIWRKPRRGVFGAQPRASQGIAASTCQLVSLSVASPMVPSMPMPYFILKYATGIPSLVYPNPPAGE